MTPTIKSKKLLFVASSLCLVFLATSCAVTQHATDNRNENITEVVLSKNNYKIIGTVSGEVSQSYVFGLGGLSKKSLKESAISDMYKKANLTGSQAIIYINVSFKYELVMPIFRRVTAVASGVVIEFTN